MWYFSNITSGFRKSNHTGWFEETRSSRSNFIKILFDKKKSKQPSVDCSLPFLVIKISLQPLKKKKKEKNPPQYFDLYANKSHCNNSISVVVRGT